MSKPVKNNIKLTLDGNEIPANDIIVSAYYNNTETGGNLYATVNFITTIDVSYRIEEKQTLCIETIHDNPNTVTELQNLTVSNPGLADPSLWDTRKALCRCTVAGKIVSRRIKEQSGEPNLPTSGIIIEKCAINSASELAKFIRQLMVLGDNVLPECRRPANDGISNSMMNRVVNANNDYFQSYWKFVDNLVSDQEFNERIEKLSRERYGRGKTENTR